MKIDVIGRNYQVSDRLKEITAQKLAKLDKYFETEAQAKVSFKKESTTLTVEIMLDYAGRLVRAAASDDNLYDQIDIVLPKLEGQIRKHRTRFDKHQKNQAYRDAAMYGGLESKETNITRKKQFKLVPMTVEQAMEEMELLGHSFYVFLEAKTNTVQVLYKRNDGDLGLIEPQI